MADFEKAYSHTAKNEGLYANNKADTGGETYMGISRNNWPKWGGWPIIDGIKKQYGTSASIINRYGSSNATLMAKVKEFYKTNFWYPLNLQLFTDQQLANNVYDFGVNAGIGRAAKFLQQAINSICGSVTVDGDIGNQTITSLSKLNQKQVYDAFNSLRKGFYDGIIRNNPSQAQFRNSWYSRIIPYKA